ncbi:hypothetical protein BC833DRAFT_574067 [Globomyces pollinis-pini]|nr:hypothetical protein BC833DRAFT_574067 [Globomyces pollinis-pini]
MDKRHPSIRHEDSSKESKGSLGSFNGASSMKKQDELSKRNSNSGIRWKLEHNSPVNTPETEINTVPSSKLVDDATTKVSDTTRNIKYGKLPKLDGPLKPEDPYLLASKKPEIEYITNTLSTKTTDSPKNLASPAVSVKSNRSSKLEIIREPPLYEEVPLPIEKAPTVKRRTSVSVNGLNESGLPLNSPIQFKHIPRNKQRAQSLTMKEALMISLKRNPDSKTGDSAAKLNSNATIKTLNTNNSIHQQKPDNSSSVESKSKLPRQRAPSLTIQDVDNREIYSEPAPQEPIVEEKNIEKAGDKYSSTDLLSYSSGNLLMKIDNIDYSKHPNLSNPEQKPSLKSIQQTTPLSSNHSPVNSKNSSFCEDEDEWFEGVEEVKQFRKNTVKSMASNMTTDTLTSKTRMAKSYVQNIYHSFISYKTESVIMLLLLLPFFVVLFGVFEFPRLVFPNYYYALTYKIIIVLIGLLGVKSIKIINRRHSDINVMRKVLNGDANIKFLYNAVTRGTQDKILSLSTAIFYGCLIATELTLETIPSETPYSAGMATHLAYDLSAVNITSSPQERFFNAIGAQYTCQSCQSIKNSNSYLVPISLFLKTAPAPNMEVIMNAPMDIISLQVTCYKQNSPGQLTSDFRFHLNSISNGQNSSAVDFRISKRTDAGILTRRCSLIARDYRGSVKIRYHTSKLGRVTTMGVTSIGPSNPATCKIDAGYCLNTPLRPNLSFTLLSNVFTIGDSNLQKGFTERFQLMPDPSVTISDDIFSKLIALNMVVALKSSVGSFIGETIPVDLLTDEISVQFNMNNVLFILTLVTASICIVLAVGLILINVLTLNQPNRLLRRLSLSMKPGAQYMADISKLVYTNYVKNDESNWDADNIRFGESRQTVKDDVGVLRFGKREDLVKYRDTKAYYSLKK